METIRSIFSPNFSRRNRTDETASSPLGEQATLTELASPSARGPLFISALPNTIRGFLSKFTTRYTDDALDKTISRPIDAIEAQTSEAAPTIGTESTTELTLPTLSDPTTMKDYLFSNFEILRLVGEGGFGRTYEAIDKRTDDIVALKIIDIKLSTEKGVPLDEIQQEVKTSQDLSTYPDCVEYVACYRESFLAEEDGDMFYIIVSEFIEGENFSDYLRQRGVLEPDEMWDYMSQLIDGLDYIHSLGYAHRDIKPSNIMISLQGRLKYVDFGVSCASTCKRTWCPSENSNPCTGRPGTIDYEPPEYFMKRYMSSLSSEEIKSEAQAHDIWSLGVVFYRMANGKAPFIFSSLDTTKSFGEKVLDKKVESNYRMGGRKENEAINYYIELMLTKDWLNRPTAEWLALEIAGAANYFTKI